MQKVPLLRVSRHLGTNNGAEHVPPYSGVGDPHVVDIPKGLLNHQSIRAILKHATVHFPVTMSTLLLIVHRKTDHLVSQIIGGRWCS